MVKKIPISFNDEDVKAVQELIDLMGITGIYGDFPKAVKFSINLTLSMIKNPEKVYHSLKTDEMDQYFMTMCRSEKKRRILEIAKNTEELAKKV